MAPFLVLPTSLLADRYQNRTPSRDLYDQNTYQAGLVTHRYRCRLSSRSFDRRIEEVTVMWLVEKFRGEPDLGQLTATRRGDTVSLELDGTRFVLTTAQTEDLQDALDEALHASQEFLHTSGTHREDGAYVVERRGADSAGNRKVFDSFSMLGRLAERLPDRVTAEDLSRVGLTAGRRHMVLWHLVEHPELPFELDGRQPLAATRTHDGGTPP